jgi:hypothetical protein
MQQIPRGEDNHREYQKFDEAKEEDKPFSKIIEF